MKLLKSLLNKKESTKTIYEDFWAWFNQHQKEFYQIVKKGNHIERDFFTKLSPKLKEITDGFAYLTGMQDEKTAELILTTDGDIKSIVFAEELVSTAPNIPNWKFTALKQAMDISNSAIVIGDYTFDSENLSFYSIDHAGYPDEIDIVLVHQQFNYDDQSVISNGALLFLDNLLGELNCVSIIDRLTVLPKEQANKELIPINKLKPFIIWREKEFIEKYNGIRHDTENDIYSTYQAEKKNGRNLIAVMNSTLLGWDSKASHPWILNIELGYDGDLNNGMPDNETQILLNDFEERVMRELKDFEGFLNVGRQTGDNCKEIFFACKDFRKPSKVLHQLKGALPHKILIDYSIYKDKYWQSFEQYNP